MQKGRRIFNREEDPLFPGKESGIYSWTSFVLLDFFDIVKDIMPDMMHIHKNFWQEHILRTLAGQTTIKAPSNYSDPEKNATYKERYKNASQVCSRIVHTIICSYTIIIYIHES